MQICNNSREYLEWHRAHVPPGSNVGLLATKGCIHAGHLALIQIARQECDFVVVTITLHPGQFSDPGDYERFPRIVPGLRQATRLGER